jgi:hypothetical protein
MDRANAEAMKLMRFLLISSPTPRFANWRQDKADATKSANGRTPIGSFPSMGMKDRRSREERDGSLAI